VALGEPKGTRRDQLLCTSAAVVLTDDSGGGADGGFVPTRIVADVRGIRDFADLLRTEIDANFQPNKERVIAEYRRGVGFGARSASMDMHVAVWKYFTCLSTAIDNLEAYVAATEVLIAAAHKIADAYRTAEQLSTASMKDIEQALNAAVGEANAAQRASVEAAHQHAIQQRLARLEQEGQL
jgi:hypothetical protein